MKNKKKTRSKIIARLFPSVFIVASGIAKIVAAVPVAEMMAQVGMTEFLGWLGLAEIVLAVMFMFKRTLVLALILLSCYFSGAIATEISHGLNGIIPIALILTIWGSAYIRNRSFFEFVSRQNKPRVTSWMNTSF